MVGKYNGPDFGFIKNVKSKADKYRNFDESASHARKASIKKLPLEPDPNVLHQFASYNTIFTLSALSRQEIRNPALFFNSAPHDIIARSGGIGDANSNTAPPGARERFTEDTKETIRKSAALRDALNRSTTEFYKNNDLYFKNVEMTSIPGLNEKRRLTSVTNIMMELVEPSGLTLLEKVKAAAANNGFLDHLDAPYMLTVEFKGFDENGKEIKERTDYIKRVIPIKLITMDIDVNQGGSYYNIKAIPYNEFALTDTFMYPRTSGTLGSTNRTFKDAVQDLQNILDEQNQDEQVKGYNQFPDRYDISISEDLNPEAQLSYELLSQAGMTQKKQIAATGESALPEAFTMEYIKFNSSTSILKLLENLMKTHPDYGAKSFDEWSKAVSTPGATTFDPNGALSTYFKYFRIRTAIEPTGDFDEIRQTNAKIIRIVVEPFYVSAYNLATPGIHQDKNYQGYVAKAYNYIFTGDNLDIQSLDINYKVAYFQSRLKDLEASDSRTFTQDNKAVTEETGTPTNREAWRSDQYLPLKSEVSGYKTSPSNRTGKAEARIDQFFDAITNPLADMVVVNMSILGDPAWMGQSQFIPATPLNANGSSQDNNINFFRGGAKDNIWNPKLKCFNYDVAEPITNLTFKVPQDFNDKTGVYEMSSAQQAVFSGLYRVTQVQHSFTDGQFTQNLTMVRFNNQDSKVTNTTNQKITKKNGVVTSSKNPMAMDRINDISGAMGSS